MSDPRTDFFASGGSSSASDQDARTSFFSSGGAGVSQSADPEDLFVGMGKYALGSVTHMAGNLADIITGTAPGRESHAERWSAPFASSGQIADPKTGEAFPDSSQESRALSDAASRGYDTVAGTGPGATEIKTRIPQALEGISTVVPAIRGIGGGIAGLRAPPMTAQEAVDAAAQASPQSQGAAAAAPRMTAVSPELQQAVVNTARATGGAVNPETLNRHMEADSLPIKIQLTPGQATQDPALISHEMNNRARIPGLPQLLDEQNRNLGRNLQAIRDEAGPDVFTTNSVEHGDTLIKAYQDKAAAADADIGAKYQALRDANGGKFPVSAPQLLQNVESKLHDALLYEHAPTQLGQLKALADKGGMTFEQFEAMRTNLARTMRSSTDGNERAAAGIIRQEMEKLPLSDETGKLKGLADQARSAAKAQFDALDADPAYKAAVNGTVPPDRFVQKFVIGGTRDDVATMRENLAHDPVATQTMGVSALDHLRRVSDPNGSGYFGQANFNRHLTALEPKSLSIFDRNTADQLEALGNVARYTQAQPKGSFVNNSNTLVGALGEHAASAAEGLVNFHAGGFPVGTIARKVIKGRTESKLAKETMSPYGGMDKLDTKQ